VRPVGLASVFAVALTLWLVATPARAAEPVAAVDLNAATAEQLCTLPGVGPKKAEAILALRKQRPFTRVTQLLEVRGIGKKTLDRLKPFVRVGPAPPAAPASTPAAALSTGGPAR
jgi:competence ComEA-like helix-hairpin-helix protein